MTWNRITSWKQRLLFVFALLSVCLYGTGCATANTWASLGKTRTGVNRIFYQYSPDTREDGKLRILDSCHSRLPADSHL